MEQIEMKERGIIELSANDGARSVICLHGGQVIGWRPAGHDADVLFLSKRADFKQGGAIRGGVPVIFPQFASEGPLQKHGFARNVLWERAAVDPPPGDAAVARLQLHDSSETLAAWPFAFRADITVAVAGQNLEISLQIENRDQLDLTFTAALHTYLRVSDIARTRVLGLAGVQYRDSAADGKILDEAKSAVEFAGEVDRIYSNVTWPLTVESPERLIEVSAEGFADAVIWNPGPEKGSALQDLEAGGDRAFVCVEPAIVSQPVLLQPSQCWTGRQVLKAALPQN